jgi:hypothetical protein
MSLRQRKGLSHLPRVTSVIITCTNLVSKWLSNTVRETREIPWGVQPINYCNDVTKYEGRTKADYNKLTVYFNVTIPKAHFFLFVSSLRWSRGIIAKHSECCSFHQELWFYKFKKLNFPITAILPGLFSASRRACQNLSKSRWFHFRLSTDLLAPCVGITLM